MKKTSFDVRALVNKFQQNCDRISEIADLCEKEQRERTEAETKEFEFLSRDNQMLQMKLQAAASEHLRENPNARFEAEKVIRENAKAGRKTEIALVRDLMIVGDMENSGLIPLNIQDILKPLSEGFILDKVGLPMLTGLAGDYVWPIYEMIQATVLGEGATLEDSKIPFSKLTAAPARIGVAVPITNQALNQTQGLLEKIVREVLPNAVKELLNQVAISVNAFNQAASTAGLVGPFVAKKANAVALSAVPTFIELNKLMKAKVLEAGITGNHMCFTMTKSMQAILEGTPINEKGVFVPMIQNGMLCGVPVYTSNYMREITKVGKKYTSGNWTNYTILDTDTIAYKVSGDSEANALATITGTPAAGSIAEVTVITEYIGFGDWAYQPMGLFGDIRFTVDPYSKARQDSVDFVLNCDYGTKTLRPEAFVLGKVSPAAN